MTTNETNEFITATTTSMTTPPMHSPITIQVNPDLLANGIEQVLHREHAGGCKIEFGVIDGEYFVHIHYANGMEDVYVDQDIEVSMHRFGSWLDEFLAKPHIRPGQPIDKGLAI